MNSLEKDVKKFMKGKYRMSDFNSYQRSAATTAIYTDKVVYPARKKKLLSKHKGNLTFYIFREDMKQAWCIDSSLLTDDKLKVAKGRNIMKGEQFYHIPYVDAKLINVKEAA